MGIVRNVFDRVVGCAKVMSHITNKEVREHLTTISNCSRISAKSGDTYIHLKMVLASQRAVAKSMRFLAEYFKSQGLDEISKSYWKDWSCWMGYSKQTLKRMAPYERRNAEASATQTLPPSDSNCGQRVGRAVQAG